MRTNREIQDELFKLRQFRATMSDNQDTQLIDCSIEWLEWFLAEETTRTT